MSQRTTLRVALATLIVAASLFTAQSTAVANHGALSGKVTDRATSQPIEKVCITIGPPVRCAAFTNAQGTWSVSLEGAPDGLSWDIGFYRDNAGCLVNAGGPSCAYTKPVLNPGVKVTGPMVVNAQMDKDLTVPTPTPAPTTPAVPVEQRIADFWKRVDALQPADPLASTDLGQWGLNVIERDPTAKISVADFRATTALMQAAMERTPRLSAPAPSPSALAAVEAKIAAFWARIDALQPGDLIPAADIGQWALNVTQRDPGAAMTAEDFRATTALMQAAFERART